ncbi:MAG: hypothetical protein HY726_07080 [Candidatus Rokubacteria bacterium]|nr:hypothetical protein [Candidatus Rokubacteria bacterium]
MKTILVGKVASSGSLLMSEDQFLPLDVDTSDDVSLSLWSHFPSARPSKNIFILDLGNPRVVLTRPLPVAIQVWPDHVSTCSYDIEEFGIGADEFEAVEDLKASIADLYFVLKREGPALGPLPQRQWAFLKGIIRET